MIDSACEYPHISVVSRLVHFEHGIVAFLVRGNAFYGRVGMVYSSKCRIFLQCTVQCVHLHTVYNNILFEQVLHWTKKFQGVLNRALETDMVPVRALKMALN